MKLYYYTAVFVLLCAVSCKKETTSFCNVKEFGAIGDNKTNNTLAIQAAIDACHKAGGGEVLIEEGNYITGTILLKDNVTLHIAEKATLIGSSNPEDYKSIDTFVDATGQNRGKCLIGAINAKNVGLIGKGKIDGKGQAFERKTLRKALKAKGYGKDATNMLVANRPFLIRFVKSKNITLKGLFLTNPAAWTCHFYKCNGVFVDELEILSHANKNNDGIDVDSSHDVIITNCKIDSGDDAICLKSTSPEATYNVSVNNCSLKSDWGAIKFGTESMGDMYNIKIKNCKINDTKGGGIKILSVDGANIFNITIDSIEMQNVDMPIFVRLGERLTTYRGVKQREVGSINDIYISNITAVTPNIDQARISPPTGVFVTGTPTRKIGKLYLDNISITLPGGGTLVHKTIEVPEDSSSYPEFSWFGILPSYGLMARHVEELNFKTSVFEVMGADARHEILMSNVDRFNKY